MSTEYSGSSASYPATVEVPGEGDFGAASTASGLSDLADRTAFLKTTRDNLVDVPVLNWWGPIRKDSNGQDLDCADAFARVDGSIQLFHARDQDAWIVLGRPADGAFYFGDAGVLESFNTGGSFPPTFGCESGGRLLLFSARPGNGGDELKFDRSDAGSVTTWAHERLPDGGAHVHARASSAVVTSTGAVCVVGGVDQHYKAWTSSDHGVHFNMNEVAAGVTLEPSLTKAALGKSDRIFAWEYETEANGGAKLFYSDNAGVTWSSVTLTGHEKIISLCYMASADKYVIFTDTEVGIATNIVTGPISWSASGGTKCAATDGKRLMFVARLGDGRHYMVTSPDVFGSARLIHRIYRDARDVAVGRDGQFAMIGTNPPVTFQASLKASPR